MSETVDLDERSSPETPVLETIEEEDSPPEEVVKPPPKKDLPTRSVGKNPNRVKAGLKLAAIGQRAKEEKMRKRVQDEMIKPSTWVMVGVVLTSVGFLGLYFSPLFSKEEEVNHLPPPKQEPKSKSYFG